MSVPEGTYGLYADDDDVIGLTVAKTYPQGWAIVRTDPPFMDAFDEYEVGQFLVWCLNNHARLAALVEEPDVQAILAATAQTNVTVCSSCGGTGVREL